MKQKVMCVSLIDNNVHSVDINSILNVCIEKRKTFTVPPWAKYIAMDKDNAWRAFHGKPVKKYGHIDAWFEQSNSVFSEFIGIWSPRNLNWTNAVFEIRIVSESY